MGSTDEGRNDTGISLFIVVLEIIYPDRNPLSPQFLVEESESKDGFLDLSLFS
jgi:hypothetical protein